MSMTLEPEWDVIVVGGGPAGSSAAKAAAVTGARVLLVDRREVIGTPVQCAEFLARNVVLDQGFPSRAIAQDVERSRTFLDDEEASVRRNPGCILNRDVADLLLWQRALDAGAVGRTSTNVTGVRLDTSGMYMVAMKDESGEAETSATVVVGADGPRSTVGAALGVSNHWMVVASQVTVPLSEPSTDTEVYLSPEFAGGYGWLFPKGELANVGVGVDVGTGANPMRALSRLLSLLCDRVGDPVRSTGGLIPVGGPLPMRLERALLVGDAAGHTHPITGGGIHQALEAGRLAGEAAGAYIEGDEDALERYEPAFMDLFSHQLGRAVERRRELVAGLSGDAMDEGTFGPLARRTWIGFKEYYRKGAER
jgi:geranylgeranyl reductase family protein